MSRFFKYFLKLVESNCTEYLNSIEIQKIKQFLSSYSSEHADEVFGEGLISDFESLVSLLNHFSDNERTYICLAYCSALHFANTNKGTMVCHFLMLAKEQFEIMPGFSLELMQNCMKLALRFNYRELALSLLVQEGTQRMKLSSIEAKKLNDTFSSMAALQEENIGHGHSRIIKYLSEQPLSYLKGKVFVEIGTTREIVPGQGSTRALAVFCRDFGINFITVDMDPNNTASAEQLFRRLGVDFLAITMKGEDFLKSYNKDIDFVFLDAYDFDHGKHDELRQKRYEKYLGSKISDKKCHKMHLECVEILAKNLSNDGVICIDDVWRDDSNEWAGKGTLAIPYMISNGFQIIEHLNNSVLISRN